MKHFFYGILLLIVLFVILLSQIEKSSKKEISILTTQSIVSRLITHKDERVTIPVYFSIKDTFFVDSTQLISSKIQSSSGVIDVLIHRIYVGEDILVWKGVEYVTYYFELSFSIHSLSNLHLWLPSSTLKLNYSNAEVLELSIGDVDLLFSDVKSDYMMDIVRMYSIPFDKSVCSDHRVFIFAIENKSSQVLTISLPQLGFSITDFQPSYWIQYSKENVRFETLESFQKSNDESIHLGAEQIVNIAIVLDKSYTAPFPSRFYGRIHYENYHFKATLLFDDFLFYRDSVIGGCNEPHIKEVVFVYPTA
jgi:hypothetical protein